MCLASPENLGREKADITGTLVLVRYNKKGTGAPNTEDEGKMREHLQTLSSASMCGQSRGFYLSRGPAIRAGLTLQIPGGELLSTKGREASSVSQQVKNLLAMQETQEMQIDPWVRKIPWRRTWQPTSVFLPGESHRQRSLAGYSPQSWRISVSQWVEDGGRGAAGPGRRGLSLLWQRRRRGRANTQRAHSLPGAATVLRAKEPLRREPASLLCNKEVHAFHARGYSTLKTP